MKIAQKITRKHRILEKFLTDILKIKEENVHEQACEMEHTLSDEAERALCTMLNNPDLCPDNNIIPACDFDFESCQQCYSQKDFDQIINRKFNLLSISELTSNSEGIISFIRGNNELLDEIGNLGIKVGLNIQYEFDENNLNGYVITVENKELNITSEMAHNIFIRI